MKRSKTTKFKIGDKVFIKDDHDKTRSAWASNHKGEVDTVVFVDGMCAVLAKESATKGVDLSGGVHLDEIELLGKASK